MRSRVLFAAVLALLTVALVRSAGAQCLQWSQLATPSQPPKWSMELVYDRARHVAVGLVGSHPTIEDRVVLYRLNAQGWTLVPYGGPAPLGPRFNYASCYHPARQTVMVFGGYTGIGGGATSANDLWEWDGFVWTRIQHPGSWPPATGSNLMVYDPGRQRVIVLVGDPNPTGLWFTWEWTGSSWEAGHTLGPIFGPRYGVSFCFDEFRGKGFVYCLDSAGFWEEVWEYTPGATAAQSAWNQVAISGPAYQGYEVVSLVYDPYRRQIVRHGGRASGSLYSFISGTSTWDPDARKWDLVAFMPDPQRRGASGVCFDSDLDRVLLYGGARQDQGTPPSFIEFRDTWSYVNQAPGLVVDVAPAANWCAGSNGVLSVSVAGSASIQWWKNNQMIPGATSTILVVSPVTAASAGVYECEVANSCGGLWSRPCTVSVTVPPAITIQPVGDSRCPGQTVHIAGPGFTGTSPEVQLHRKNGEFWENVPYVYNAIGNFYDLPNAQHSDSGTYRFQVSNSCGTAYSGQFQVQVGVTFDLQPQSQARQPCETVVFTVGAHGVNWLSHSWRHNGVPLIDDGRISGVITPSLTINGMRYEDEGTYDCVVTDSCESRASTGALLSMQSPPQWVHRTSSGPVRRVPWYTDMAYDEARGVCVLYGGSVWVSATSSLWGDDTWEWDGIAWTRRFPATSPGPLAGHEMVYDSVRNKVLLFGGYSPTAPFGDARVWQYDGTNWTLLTTSPGGPSPNNYYQGDAVFDRARGKMILLANHQGGTYPANQTWEFDPATLAWQATYAGTSFVYDQSPLVYDAMQQTVLATSGLNLIALPWRYTGAGWQQLGVIGPFRYSPVVAFDAFRNRATLFGNARNELNYPNFHNDTYALIGTAWTQILPEFQPVAANRLWPAAMCFDTKRNAMVVVGNTYNNYVGLNPMDTWEYRYVDKVVFDRQPEDQPLVVGDNVQFSVYAAGAGTLTYQWRKGTAPLANGPTPGGSVVSGAQTNTLTITGAVAADAGAYRCLVSNACGAELSASARLGTTCYPDCNGDGALTVADFGCFQTAFISGNLYADCNQSGTLTIADFGCFQTAFVVGCP